MKKNSAREVAIQIKPDEFLPIAEHAGALAFVDIEASGLKGDYNSGLVVSIKPYHKPPITLSVDRPGDDKQLVVEARNVLARFPLWVSFYGKGFDIPFLRTRLLHHRCNDLPYHHHLDIYWIMRFHTLTARRSQGHLLEFLDSPMKKLTLSPELWNRVLSNPARGLPVLRRRCESDVAGLEALYDRVKHLVREITR